MALFAPQGPHLLAQGRLRRVMEQKQLCHSKNKGNDKADGTKRPAGATSPSPGPRPGWGDMRDSAPCKGSTFHDGFAHAGRIFLLCCTTQGAALGCAIAGPAGRFCARSARSDLMVQDSYVIQKPRE